MSALSGFVLFCLILTVGFLGTVLRFIADHEPLKCDMTYMFEYPQFVRISNKVDNDYKKYGLYAYSEGRLTEKARNMNFDGIPVLFIPGSGGSHKQVRSLASIALRKALNSRTRFHFDYFTVDLNNELSGLNGGLLEGQLTYVRHCIQRVLELYDNNRNPPKSIVLIGHSMGGVIAKSILARLPDGSPLVSIVITLSSPLEQPTVEFDYFFQDFYNTFKNFSLPEQTTFVSVAGGYNDYLVPTYLTGTAQINVVATAIPRLWSSMDHVSSVWCKQFVLALNRALFECVDLRTHQITTDHEARAIIFNHHLVKHSGIRMGELERYNQSVQFDVDATWHESIYRQFAVGMPHGSKELRYYMIPLSLLPAHEQLVVVVQNIQSRDWVYSCSASHLKGSSRICVQGSHLTHLSEISPSLNFKRRTLRINMHELRRLQPHHSHVIVRVKNHNDPMAVQYDVHNIQSRRFVHRSANRLLYKKDTVIEETEEKAIHYEIVLPDLSLIIHAYWVYLEPFQCTAHQHHATASLVIPWDNYDMHSYVTDDLRKPIYFKLHAPRPEGTKYASIRLTLDPACRYKVSVQSIYDFGNMARFSMPLLVGNVVAVILMTLRSQLINIGSNQHCSPFFSAIKNGTKPYFTVMPVKVLTKIFGLPLFLRILPYPDWQYLADNNLDYLLLPVLLYLVSVGIVWMMSLMMFVSFVCFESTIHKWALKFASKAFSKNISWSDHLINAFHKIPGIIAVLLIAMSISTNGGLALTLAAGFYFLKLTQMSQDFIEDFVKGIAKAIGRRMRDKVINKIKQRWRKQPSSALPIEPTLSSSNDTKVIEPANSNGALKDSVAGSTSEESKEQVNNTNDESSENLLSGINFNIFKEVMENDEIFFHFTIFMLYCVSAILSIPSVLTWAHNFKYGYTDPDPARIPAIILTVCAFPLWQLNMPKTNKIGYTELSYAMYAAALDSLLFGVVSVFRLSYIIAGVVACITLHQLAMPERAIAATTEEADELDEEDTYDARVKTKLE